MMDSTVRFIPSKYRQSLLAIIILCSVFISSCQNTPVAGPPSPIAVTPTATFPPPTGSPTVTPTPTISPAQEAAREAWLKSRHANNYALEKGPNTYCAQCHSPANWDPAAVIDPPPNCVTCKFSFESEPRIAVGNPLVPEEEWAGIDCAICHQTEGGFVEASISWFDRLTNERQEVDNSSQICEKCHRDKEPSLHHKRDLGSGAHANFTCTSCHDPHSTAANCSSKGCHHAPVSDNGECVNCHPDALASHTMEQMHSGGHDCLGCHADVINASMSDSTTAAHTIHMTKIACVACHDASGLQVGPLEQAGVWMTWRTVETPLGSSTEPYQSHTLQRSVDCQKCHYAENPWGLPMFDAAETP